MLLNALDASTSGQEVVVRFSDAGGQDARSPAERCEVIEVLDDGPGLPTNPEIDIFEPFVSTKKDTGLGLGLSIRARLPKLTVESSSPAIGRKAEPCFACDCPLRGRARPTNRLRRLQEQA